MRGSRRRREAEVDQVAVVEDGAELEQVDALVLEASYDVGGAAAAQGRAVGLQQGAELVQLRLVRQAGGPAARTPGGGPDRSCGPRSARRPRRRPGRRVARPADPDGDQVVVRDALLLRDLRGRFPAAFSSSPDRPRALATAAAGSLPSLGGGGRSIAAACRTRRRCR